MFSSIVGATAQNFVRLVKREATSADHGEPEGRAPCRARRYYSHGEFNMGKEADQRMIISRRFAIDFRTNEWQQQKVRRCLQPCLFEVWKEKKIIYKI